MMMAMAMVVAVGARSATIAGASRMRIHRSRRRHCRCWFCFFFCFSLCLFFFFASFSFSLVVSCFAAGARAGEGVRRLGTREMQKSSSPLSFGHVPWMLAACPTASPAFFFFLVHSRILHSHFPPPYINNTLPPHPTLFSLSSSSQWQKACDPALKSPTAQSYALVSSPQ